MRIKLLPLLILVFISTFLLSTYIYLVSFYFSHQNQPINTQNPKQPSTEKVIRVIDGDTFEIEGGIKVRLIGIDTPEMKNKNKTIDCFAQEAKDKLTSLLLNQEVVLEKDVSETDKYGRLLRYVYLNETLINDQLVREGYAKISTFPPDVKLIDLFLESEGLARKGNKGLWGKCQ